jgi:NADPH-dependent F420 reductase
VAHASGDDRVTKPVLAACGEGPAAASGLLAGPLVAGVRTVGIVSGTGPHGRGLAWRFARAGHKVLLGSRDADRAARVTDRLPRGDAGSIIGVTNEGAAQCDIVVVAAAWSGCDEVVVPLASLLAGKVVISCVNPLGFDAAGPHRLATQTPSAAEHIARLLPRSCVVGAFHHLSAVSLLDPSADLGAEDILVCGDDDLATAVVRRLCLGLTGRVGIEAGPLRLARYIEPFTAVLISINQRYAVQSGVAVPHVRALRATEAVRRAEFGVQLNSHPRGESA